MTIHGGLRARALTLAALAAAFSPAHAQSPDPGSTRLILGFEQHFAPEENLEAVDVAEIATAGETVNLAAYVLTDLSVIDALTDAAARGVRVRVWRQPDDRPPSPPLTDALARLAAAGAEIHAKPHGALMHLKAYCIDHHALRIGAANFSHSGLTEQDNDIEIFRGAGVCARFEAKFESMWSGR